MTITTPSGYQVELVDKLNFGQRRRLKTLFMDHLKVNMGKVRGEEQQINSFALGIINRVQDEAMRLMLISIVKDGKRLTRENDDLLGEVMDWDDPDGEAVYTAVEDIMGMVGLGGASQEETEQKKMTSETSINSLPDQANPYPTGI